MRIVLAHGFPGFVRLPVIGLEYFRGVRQFLESKFPNVQVKVTRVDPLGTIEQRAREFRRQVEEFAAERVHIIGHSAGGLDARFLVSPNGSDMARTVASITTIATPHLGTPVADWFAHPNREVADLIARFSRFADGLRHLTKKAMEDFNKEYPSICRQHSLLQLCGQYGGAAFGILAAARDYFAAGRSQRRTGHCSIGAMGGL